MNSDYDDCLAAYVAAPGDATFQALSAAAADNRIIDDLFTLLATGGASASVSKHLALALGLVGRVLESEYYVAGFLATTPADVAALRIYALLACQRSDFKSAKKRWSELKARGASDSALWLVEVVLLLHAGEDQAAADCARHMLEAPPLDPYAKQAATIAALRSKDLPLFLAATALPGGQPGLKKNERMDATELVRAGLLRLLRHRSEAT